MSVEFEGKAVLVVGGTSGIGAGIARAFQAAGVGVRVTGRTDQEASDARSGGLDAAPLDVTDTEGIGWYVSQLEQLDALVNCAGGGYLIG